MTKNFKFIRKADKEDASRLAEMLIFAKRTAYRNIFNDDKTSFGKMQVFPLALEYMNNPTKLNGIYAFDDDFVKGMINIEVSGRFEIRELYIDPFFQGQKIGEALLSYAQELACSLGFDCIILWVLEKNTVAKAFYKKHGFVETGERKLEEGTNEFVACYKNNLKDLRDDD